MKVQNNGLAESGRDWATGEGMVIYIYIERVRVYFTLFAIQSILIICIKILNSMSYLL